MNDIIMEELKIHKNGLKMSMLVLLLCTLFMATPSNIFGMEYAAMDNNKTIGYANPRLTDKGSVVTYSQTESTVNGVPFLPFGLYAVGKNDIARVAEYGFNLVQDYGFVNWDEAAQRDYLDTAKQNNVMVFVTLGANNGLTPERKDKIKKIVNTFKDHPAIYAWYLADEPEKPRVSPEELIDMYQWIKQADPNHPVVNSNWYLSQYKDAGDADMRQLYYGIPSRCTANLKGYLATTDSLNESWIAILNSYDSGWGYNKDKVMFSPASVFGKLSGMGRNEKSAEWKQADREYELLMKNLENPVAINTNTDVNFCFSPNYPDSPLLIRSSFYWPLIHGSNGFYYWLYQRPGELNKRWGYYTVFHKGVLRNAIKNTFSEINGISKFLVNPAKNSVSFEDETFPGLYIWSKVVDGERIIVILNETGIEFQGEIDLSRLSLKSKKLKVYKEDERTMQVKNGKLIESFKKEEVHVYFVK